MPVSIQLLSRFSLLATLGAEEQGPLSLAMTLKEFGRRAVVIEKDSPSSSLGFLVEGRLQGVDFTVDGRSVGLYFVDPGDYFGELPIVDGHPSPEHTVAVVKSTVAFLDGRVARELILNQPALAQSVMERLAARVRAGMAQRTVLSLPNPFQRLCALLLQLMTAEGGGVAIIEQVPTHQELAIMINASRETVTRIFQVFFAHQILIRDGVALKLLQTDWLRQIAQGRVPPPKM